MRHHKFVPLQTTELSESSVAPKIFEFLEPYFLEITDFMQTILFYEWQKKPAAALITPLFLIFQVSVSQDNMLWSWEIKEQESEIFTIDSNIHLGVTDVLSAVKSGLCKLQKEMLLKKV